MHRGDLDDLESLRSGAAKSDAVIHTAFFHDFSRFQENCETDKGAIEALGDPLAGSDRLLMSPPGLGCQAQGQAFLQLKTIRRSVRKWFLELPQRKRPPRSQLEASAWPPCGFLRSMTRLSKALLLMRSISPAKTESLRTSAMGSTGFGRSVGNHFARVDTAGELVEPETKTSELLFERRPVQAS